MASSPAQLQFAVQFASFLVAAGGFALVLLRAELLSRSSRGAVVLGAGFAGLASVAFVQGSLLVAQGTSPVLLGAQAASLACLLLGSAALPARPAPEAIDRARPAPAGGRLALVSRSLLWMGVALQGAALALTGHQPVVGAALLGGGAAAIGAALVASSRRSIAGRVAASAGGTLLALVLVLSVALSEVVSSTVQNDAVRRLDARAASETSQLIDFTYSLRNDANLFGAAVTSDITSTSCQGPVDLCVQNYVPIVAANYFNFAEVAWVSPSGSYIAGSLNLPTALGATAGLALAASPVVADTIPGDVPTASVEIVERQLVSVATYPEAATMTLGGRGRLLGVAVVASPLDDSYLRGRHQDDPTLSLALGDAQGLLAASGAQPRSRALAPLVTRVLAGSGPVHVMEGDRFVSLQPVEGVDNRPVAVLVASTSTRGVDQTRRSLFRTLFLIALGGTLLALLLASAVGDRVGAGLRRLTVVAEAVRRGERGVRADLDTGDEVGALGSAFDSMAISIDEKTAALREAAADEARLRNRLEAVVAGMGEALVAVDAESRVTDFNQAAEELTGIRADQARGQPLDEVVVLTGEDGGGLVGEDGAGLGSHLRQRPGPGWSMQGWAHQPDGTAVPVALSAGEVRGSGPEAVGAVLVIRDLRREREVERMKTEFLSRIGHELRTPLTGIMGFTDLLARTQVSPERARSWHGEILEQSKRLLRTVEMLEFFASSGAGRVRLQREELDPRSFVDDLVRRWSPRLDDVHILQRRVARDLPPLTADRRWLTLAVDELLDNAFKFSPHGGRVTLRVSPAADGRSIEISVADQGKGMSEEEASQAFADFTQGDSSDTRQYGGLGLGLSLVQRVAEGHGGTVGWESEPGRGSRFWVSLPSVVEGGAVPSRNQGASRPETAPTSGHAPPGEVSAVGSDNG